MWFLLPKNNMISKKYLFKMNIFMFENKSFAFFEATYLRNQFIKKGMKI